MAWDVGNQKVTKFVNYNSIVKELSGDLEDIEARLTLTKFLKTNIGFTFQMLTGGDTNGIRLMPIQEIIIKSLMIRDNSLIVAGRGFSKSTLISVFGLLYSIFYPDTKIVLISANFRGSRRILEACEKMVDNKDAVLLKSCFP